MILIRCPICGLESPEHEFQKHNVPVNEIPACRFCYSAGVLIRIGVRWAVTCQKCGMTGPHADTADKAVAAWACRKDK